MTTIIVAMTRARVIGRGNKLPWKIKEEMQHFKQTTTGGVVIMGRKTFESIGRPLPNRFNIVVSRSMEPREGIEVARSVEEAIEKAKKHNLEIFIIGGAEIYRQALPMADKIMVSLIKTNYDGDTYFPEIGKEWKEENREDRREFEIVTYARESF